MKRSEAGLAETRFQILESEVQGEVARDRDADHLASQRIAEAVSQERFDAWYRGTAACRREDTTVERESQIKLAPFFTLKRIWPSAPRSLACFSEGACEDLLEPVARVVTALRG